MNNRNEFICIYKIEQTTFLLAYLHLKFIIKSTWIFEKTDLVSKTEVFIKSIYTCRT